MRGSLKPFIRQLYSPVCNRYNISPANIFCAKIRDSLFLDDCAHVRSDYRCRIFGQFFIHLLSWQRTIKSISTIIRPF